MNTTRGLDDEHIDGRDGGLDDEAGASSVSPHEAEDVAVNDVMFDLGGDERRMHVRAYNHWVSLLKGRPYPSIADLEPDTITDFGPHSVLLDFSSGVVDPRIAYLGQALRHECGLQGPVSSTADVPSRSLLSRLTDHYLQIIANRAPIGFEAEFVSSRGRTTLYRGILMPFSSRGDAIDFIYGVINWKELADAEMQAALSAELNAAVRLTTHPLSTSVGVAQVWADGPSSGFEIEELDLVAVETTAPAVREPVVDPLPSIYRSTGALGEQLAMARESAAQVRVAEARSRAALHRTLGRAYDLALSAEREGDSDVEKLPPSRMPDQATSAMQSIALVFGSDFDPGRLAEFAYVLLHARRHQVPMGGLSSFLSGFDGDLRAIASAERLAPTR
jgi:hypothetical protein